MGWVVNATPRPLYPRERPGTHCIGGWVRPRAGLDRCGKSRLTWIRSSYTPARSESLYRLSYHDPHRTSGTFKKFAILPVRHIGHRHWITRVKNLYVEIFFPVLLGRSRPYKRVPRSVRLQTRKHVILHDAVHLTNRRVSGRTRTFRNFSRNHGRSRKFRSLSIWSGCPLSAVRFFIRKSHYRALLWQGLRICGTFQRQNAI